MVEEVVGVGEKKRCQKGHCKGRHELWGRKNKEPTSETGCVHVRACVLVVRQLFSFL